MKIKYLNQTSFLFILLLNLQSYTQTQMEMNQDAYNDYSNSDNELNDTYQEVIEKYKSDTIFNVCLRLSTTD